MAAAMRAADISLKIHSSSGATQLSLVLALLASGCGDDGVEVPGSTTGTSTGTTASDDPSASQPTGSATGSSTGPIEPGSSSSGTSTGPIEPESSSSGTSTGPIEPGSSSDTGTGDATGSTGSTGSTGDTEAPPDLLIDVQILAINDLHGNLEPPAGSSGTIKLPDNTVVDAGGAAYLASHVAALRADNPNTIVVSAGDLVGASPLISALFHDEPTIEVMNQIGLDYNAVGNHEFDDGSSELLRMQVGGCHPVDGCVDGTPFPGADFQFLAANVLVSVDPLKTLFPSYAIHEVDGVKVAFIGMTLEDTPDIVTPTGVAGLTFVDEAERANALVPELQALGIEAIVLLIHEGGYPTGYYNECPQISGPIVDIVTNLSDEIDLVISGHTHQGYNCVIDDTVVTSAASFGRLVTAVDLQISVSTGDVVTVAAENVIVTRDQADPDVAAFVATYKELAAPLADKPVGDITATLERYPPMMKPGLSTMGLVIADAQLAATAAVMLGGAEIAFMNPGGVRADLVYPATAPEPVDGVVRYGEAFTVQPFGNSLVVMDLTGAQIDTLLEQEFTDKMGVDPKILQVSAGFTFAYSESAPYLNKVDPASIKLNGVTLVPDQVYRVTVNSFLAAGGDGFKVLLAGTDRIGGANDLDALVDYFDANSPVAPPALDRITVLP